MAIGSDDNDKEDVQRVEFDGGKGKVEEQELRGGGRGAGSER